MCARVSVRPCVLEEGSVVWTLQGAGGDSTVLREDADVTAREGEAFFFTDSTVILLN